VKAFLRAAYSHDAASFNALVIPEGAAKTLLSTDKVDAARLEELEREINSVKPEQLQPFRHDGAIVRADSNGQYPDGTSTRYLTAIEGNLTVISLVKKAGRWLIDARWWLKMHEMSLRSEKDPIEAKELIIRTFLMNLLRLNRRGVTKSLVPHADLKIAFDGAPAQPEPSDQLFALAMEMPLVEAASNEIYVLPSGKLARNNKGAGLTIMVGLYGPTEMVFVLRQIKGEWRVVPQRYYPLINR